jgi:acylglycerol lipase
LRTWDLHQHVWVPQGTVRAAVVIAHGYGEHGGRYAALARAFTDAGIAVYACDHQGHGLSAGKRGRIDRFAHQVADFSTFFHLHNEECGWDRVFLLGHSLGALVIGHFVLWQRPEVRGLIFSSGVLEIGTAISPLLQRLSGILSAGVPWLPLVRIRPELTSRLRESVQRYATDPLIFHGRICARTGDEILRAAQQFRRRMHEIDHPLLILHGTDDRLTDPEGSRALHARAASSDKTLKLYDGAFHEMLHDVNAPEFIDDIRTWIVARIETGPQ